MKNYNQHCGIASALDLLGERWTFLILRELLLGPRRYGEIHSTLTGLTTNLLATRLKSLEAADLIEKTAGGYALTTAGRRAAPILYALAEFGTAHLTFPPSPEERSDPRWLVINPQNRYLGGWTGCFALTLDGTSIIICDNGQGLEISDQSANDPPETSLTTQGLGLARWILMGAEIERMIALRSVRLSGPIVPVLSFEAQLAPAA